MKLLLASGSPRRRQLLATCGIPIAEICPSQIPEVRDPHESPEQYCQRLAFEKAHAIDRPNHCILAADTIVSRADQIFEKPIDQQHAIDMLQQLTNGWHNVYTAWYLRGRRNQHGISCSQVCFRDLRLAEIQSYVQTGEGTDKAGGYGIQGLGAALIDRIKGSYSNVVGLPMIEVLAALAQEGIVPHVDAS